MDEDRQLYIEKITRDSGLWTNKMLPKLKEFYMSKVLPEIARKKYERYNFEKVSKTCNNVLINLSIPVLNKKIINFVVLLYVLKYTKSSFNHIFSEYIENITKYTRHSIPLTN